MPAKLFLGFAAGALEPEILGRSGASDRPQWIAHRDLTRYYQLLSLELARVRLSVSEARVVAAACNGLLTTRVDDARVLWVQVEDYLAGIVEDATNAMLHGDPEPNPVADRLLGSDPVGDETAVALAPSERAVLVAKLRALSPAAALAVCDAAERYWTLVSGGNPLEPLDELVLLRAVRLTR